MPHPYDEIVKHFSAAFNAILKAGLADILPKGGAGSVLLAHHLNHALVPGDKGSDACDGSGNHFEYKVSITDQFNFHFGARRETEKPEDAVKRHFKGIVGAYCARRDGASFVQIAYCPSAGLVKHLSTHFSTTTGGQLNKNFTIRRLLELPGATLVHPKDGG